MSNLVWVEITPDFDPVEYMEALGEESDAVDVLREANEEEQLLHLYEWGFLSKRDGKMKYILPEELLDEGKAKDYLQKLQVAHSMAKSGGAGRVGAVGKTAQAALGAMSKKQKAALAAGTVGAAVGARALYKKMKKKKAQKESLDEQDWAEIVQESMELGFDFNDWDELDETLEFGEYIDAVLVDAEEQGLTEEYSEEDIIEAALEEEDDEVSEGYGQKAKEFLLGKKGFAPGAQSGKSGIRKAVEKGASSLRKAPGELRAGYKQVASAKKLARGGEAAQKVAAAHRAKGIGKMKGAAGKIGLGAAGAVGAGLAARAVYKKMKQRRAARKARNEDLNSYDLDHLLTDAMELGLECDGYEELLDALTVGEYIDASILEAEEDGLVEDLSDEEVIEAVIYDMDEAAKDWLQKKAGRLGELTGVSQLRRGRGVSKYAKEQAGSWNPRIKAMAGGSKETAKKLTKSGAKRLAVTGAAALGAAALAKKALKRRKAKKEKKESLDYTGYRSSAEGGIFESGPIPFGTGNRLYDRGLVDSVLEAFPQKADRLKKALED